MWPNLQRKKTSASRPTETKETETVANVDDLVKFENAMASLMHHRETMREQTPTDENREERLRKAEEMMGVLLQGVGLDFDDV